MASETPSDAPAEDPGAEAPEKQGRGEAPSPPPAEPRGRGGPAWSGRERTITIGAAAVCVVAALFIGRSMGSKGPAVTPPTVATTAIAPADPAASEVSAGLAAKDPAQAVVHFRRALELAPNHYGATFQLARALDRAGRTDEATKQWERVLALAEQARDPQLVEAARKRLEEARKTQADPMAAGLDALYTRRDPVTAVARFREVLAQNPEHYGATFQLATALDQARDLAGSRKVWAKMAKMADATGDAKTAEAARARLAEIEKILGPERVDPDAAAMQAAVELLYAKRDPAGAAAELRKILARSPGHYGATFQLATALDQAGKPAEARPHWQKMLEMAEAVGDEKTAGDARARLAKKP